MNRKDAKSLEHMHNTLANTFSTLMELNVNGIIQDSTREYLMKGLECFEKDVKEYMKKEGRI